MFSKVHYQDDQEDLFKACGGRMSFLLDTDARIKSAASAVVSRQVMADHKPPAGWFAQHMVIMGDGEMYGFNRNGDFFSKRACIARHPTFVSHGAYFREHNHASKANAIGIIKFAAHNAACHRTELIVHGQIKKAEDIYEALKSGNARSNSMSCRVNFDVCSICDNKAPTPEFYCKHAADHMGQYIPSAKKYAYVDNPHPTFFDASDVAYPADRIAHYLEYVFPDGEGMRKVASGAAPVITGAQWAKFNGVTLPAGPELNIDPYQMALLEKLASHEQWVADRMHEDGVKRAADQKTALVRDIVPDMYDSVDDADLSALRSIRPGALFGTLAKHAAVLPFIPWLSWMQNRPQAEVAADPVVKLAATHYLPQAFRRLVKTGCCCEGMSPEIFAGDSPGTIAIDAGLSDPVNRLMGKLGEKYSHDPAEMKARIIRITIVKSGSVSPAGIYLRAVTEGAGDGTERPAEKLAGVYAMYKLAALETMRQYGIDIGEPLELIMAASNSHQNILAS